MQNREEGDSVHVKMNRLLDEIEIWEIVFARVDFKLVRAQKLWSITLLHQR